MKTFREYLNDCEFEEVWHLITENFSESEELKPVYAEYFEKLKALPGKESKGIIELHGCTVRQPDGMNAAPDWLIDRKVKTSGQDSASVSAVLLYWASLHTFSTSKEHDEDLWNYLDILESDDPKALGEYLMKSIEPDPLESEKRESLDRKERLFWDHTFDRATPGDWRGILYVLKRKLEFSRIFRKLKRERCLGWCR